LDRSWDIKGDESYAPKVTIIVPTYNEAKLVERKLENMYEQDYPRGRIEVIVVDSVSTDGTPELVKKWAKRHPDLNLRLVIESVRKGKAYALNHALKYATGEMVVITDVVSLWPDRKTLVRALSWFADPRVGAVSCVKRPVGLSVGDVEKGYRRYYNVLRVAESKVFATPIFHGELAAFRKDLLMRIGGFPTDVGADDSHTATRIALMGFRAIVPEDLFDEFVPGRGYFWWRVRRAQHLIQHFIKCLRELKRAPGDFGKVLIAEAYLHVINPYLLLVSVVLLVVSAVLAHSLMGLTALVLGAVLLIVKQYRMWVVQQLHLMVAGVRNLWTKELVWGMQTK